MSTDQSEDSIYLVVFSIVDLHAQSYVLQNIIQNVSCYPVMVLHKT